MSNQEEIGTLVVVVLKARNLNDKHFYKQDVYATVTLNGVKKTTPIDVKGGQHPVWDVEIRFPIMKDTSSKARTLEASCFSKEHKDDDLLGEGKVDINETLKTGEFDDWVPLTVNGSSRGDIYLEMTYFSNGPAPANLSAPNNLARRPSKLSPADRVWRPSPGHTPPKSHANLPPQNSSIGPTPPKTSPKRDNTALPQFQVQSVPATLKPGLAAGRVPTPQQSYQAQPASRVPTILRPANPKGASDSSLNHSRRSSGPESESLPTPPFGTNGQPSSGIPNYPQPSNQNSYTSIPNANFGPHSNPWGYNQHPNSHSADAPISFSFPVPDVTSPALPNPSPPRSTTPYDPAPPGSYYQPHSFSPAPPPTHHRNSSAEYPQSYRPQNQNENLPDPYLIARYQTPLPLPPGADPPAPRPAPQHHRTSSFPSSSPEQVSSPTFPPPHDKPQPPLPVPARPTPPIRQPTPVDEERLRVLREAEERAARRREQEERDAELARQLDRDLSTEQDHPPPPPVPRKSKSPSPTRYSQSQSDAEARRRAQEEKDMELARQLDRELNLNGNDRSSSPRMPGGM